MLTLPTPLTFMIWGCFMLYIMVLAINTCCAFCNILVANQIYKQECDRKPASKLLQSPFFLNLCLALFTPVYYLAAYQFLELAAHDSSKLFVSILGAICYLPPVLSTIYVILKYNKLTKSAWCVVHMILNLVYTASVLILIGIS